MLGGTTLKMQSFRVVQIAQVINIIISMKKGLAIAVLRLNIVSWKSKGVLGGKDHVRHKYCQQRVAMGIGRTSDLWSQAASHI
jgi:hypothetical protein